MLERGMGRSHLHAREREKEGLGGCREDHRTNDAYPPACRTDLCTDRFAAFEILLQSKVRTKIVKWPNNIRQPQNSVLRELQPTAATTFREAQLTVEFALSV